MRNFKPKLDTARGFVRGFVEGAFKPSREKRESAYGEEEFAQRSEEDQADLFFKLHSLVAERKDLQRSAMQLKEQEQKNETPRYVVKVLSGRRVRVPISETPGGEDYREAARAQTASRLEEVKTEIEQLGTVPGFKEAYEHKLLKTWFLMRAAAEVEEVKNRNAEIDSEIDRITSEALEGSTGAVRGVEHEQIALLQQERKDNEDKIASLDAYEGGHTIKRLHELREYVDAISRDHMIEFPSAKAVVQDGLENMRRHQPFLLAGHLGSGKTELARHMAKLYMIENGVGFDAAKVTDVTKLYDSLEPEFFSGSDEASVYDLVGKLRLRAKEVQEDPKQVERLVTQMEVSLKAKGIEVPANVVGEILMRRELDRSAVSETVFNYGPLGRALRDGRPIIIDEVNTIPADVLSRLNDVLLRGVGDQVRLQENGEEPITVKHGFAVIATCNLGSQYEGIKEVNAAFKSRWVAKEVYYPEVEETYDLILASLLRKDRVRLPPDFPAEEFDRLVDLSIVVREIQELFSGRTEGQRFMAMARGVAAERAQLEKAVISTRDLVRKIIQPWKQANFRVPLEELIAKNVLAAEVWSPDDQKFMTEMFLRRGFFQEWDEKRFHKMGIQSVSQKEIGALQAAMALDDYKNDPTNQLFDSLRTAAHGRASLVQQELMIGVRNAGREE